MDEVVVDTGCGLTATGYKKITPGWLDVAVVLVEDTGAVEIGGNDAVEVGAVVVSLTGVTVTVVVTTCVGVVGVVVLVVLAVVVDPLLTKHCLVLASILSHALHS